MNSPLKPATVAMLSLAPALWAGNAIVGRLAHDLISPFALNFLRWCIAFVLLLPLAWRVLRRNSPIWPLWRPSTSSPAGHPAKTCPPPAVAQA